jgi:peptidoglycan/LPS O-acetylase OafA/YrhL
MVRRLLELNGLSIISVVLFHSAGMAFVAMFAWSHRYLPPGMQASEQIGSLSYYYLRAIEQFVVFSIPAFLFVSGYFVSVATSRDQGTLGWDVVWSRIKYLLVPYLIWSIVALVLTYLENGALTIQDLVLGLLLGNSNEAMYYVPLLTQFYLISPLLVIFARRNWKLFITVAAIIQLIAILLAYPTFLGLDIPNAQEYGRLIPKWFFPARILWFSLGIAFGLNITQFKPFINRYGRVFLAIAVLCIPIGMIEWELYFGLSGESWLNHRETIMDTLYSLAFIFGFLGIQRTIPSAARLGKLGVKSYGIYLTHAILIVVAARAIYHLAPRLLASQVVLQLILFTMGLGGPLIMMEIVNRSPFRKYFKHLFG